MPKKQRIYCADDEIYTNTLEHLGGDKRYEIRELDENAKPGHGDIIRYYDDDFQVCEFTVDMKNKTNADKFYELFG